MRARLVLVSFLMLFTELALIRWAGSNVIYLSYFSNFILLGSFLGIGLGFLRARARRDLFGAAPIALAALVVFIRVFPVEIDRSGEELIFFGSSPAGLPTWVMLPVIFAAVAAVMMFIAEGVARVFVTFEPLEAYRLDILGSITGIAAFTALSFLHAPPVAWGAIAAVGFAVALWPRVRAHHVLATIAIVVALLGESLVAVMSWSPYYKIRVMQLPLEYPSWGVNVNGIPHQQIQPIEPLRASPIYLQPYRRAPRVALNDVLIVGAGTGNDVALALDQGARHVDAVEIDPRILQIGRELHPNQPYQSERVRQIVDDGRAFLQRTDQTYDLIVFALPDSLTLVAGQSSVRLESYLFTRQAIEAARARLAPGGVFAMYNFYREPWLIDRMRTTLADVFGRQPCLDEIGEHASLGILTVAQRSGIVGCDTLPARAGDRVEPVTDDRPFPYLRAPGIPDFYLATIALILAVSLLAIRAVGGRLARLGSFMDLFAMGAAFLLLETMHVVRFALLFGTTWLVNAVVFGGILVSVYLAIEVSRRFRIARATPLYGLLLLSVGIAYALPEHVLLALEAVPRLASATALAFTPVFLANLVFAQRFRDVGDSTTAFAANLLGAMFGGVLEYVALITGYRALLLLVAGLYGAAFVLRPRAAGPGEGSVSTLA